MNATTIRALIVLLWTLSLNLYAADSASSVRKIQTGEFDRLRAKTNHVVLDVRTPEEFNAGHVPHAVNLNFQSPDFAKNIAGLDKGKTYLVHCARGRRSAAAVEQLGKAGITNVLDFTGGFDAWQKAGKPIEK